jgi:hypothetical protein
VMDCTTISILSTRNHEATFLNKHYSNYEIVGRTVYRKQTWSKDLTNRAANGRRRSRCAKTNRNPVSSAAGRSWRDGGGRDLVRLLQRLELILTVLPNGPSAKSVVIGTACSLSVAWRETASSERNQMIILGQNWVVDDWDQATFRLRSRRGA